MMSKRDYNIDLFRFLFCISVVLLHFSAMMPTQVFNELPVFVRLKSHYSLGYLCVDFFFIMSGYYWGLGVHKNKNLYDFFMLKIFRFLPVMLAMHLLYIIFYFLIDIKLSIFYNIENIFLLTGLGITHNNTTQGLGNLHPTWFVSALFWVLMLFQYI